MLIRNETEQEDGGQVRRSAMVKATLCGFLILKMMLLKSCSQFTDMQHLEWYCCHWCSAPSCPGMGLCNFGCQPSTLSHWPFSVLLSSVQPNCYIQYFVLSVCFLSIFDTLHFGSDKRDINRAGYALVECNIWKLYSCNYMLARLFVVRRCWDNRKVLIFMVSKVLTTVLEVTPFNNCWL